jgi:hypothetical protein
MSDKNEPKVLVKFLRSYPPWNRGEVAGFPEKKALKLTRPIPAKQGGPLAEIYEEGEK